MFPFMFIFMCMLALAGLGEVGLAPFVLALLFELPAGVQAADMNTKVINVERTIFRRMSFLLYVNELNVSVDRYRCSHESRATPLRVNNAPVIFIQLMLSLKKNQERRKTSRT